MHSTVGLIATTFRLDTGWSETNSVLPPLKRPTGKGFQQQEEVRHELHNLNPSKAAGPDMVSPHALKTCAEQLAYSLSYFKNLCFSNDTVPLWWKKSCIVPIPKKAAMASAVIKVCKGVILNKLVVLSRILLIHCSLFIKITGLLMMQLYTL